MYDEVGVDGRPYERGQWRAIAIHSEEKIHGFFGPYRFLSNMWPVQVCYDGTDFPSVENAYQAAKFGRDQYAFFSSLSPKESKSVSRAMTMVHPSFLWEEKRVKVMRTCLVSKFSDPTLLSQLLATAPKHLAETNWWGDYFWGCDKDNVGENQLGKLLMEIRTFVGRSL